MKRIVTIGAVITVFAVAPSVAAASSTAAGSPQATKAAAKQQRARLQAPLIAFEQGGHQVFRVGNHIMY